MRKNQGTNENMEFHIPNMKKKPNCKRREI